MLTNYKKLRAELAERYKSEVLSKKALMACEAQIFKDLVETEKKCAKCWRTENLSLDHIVPRDILRMFGMDVERDLIEDNYQILCRPCNGFKANKLDFSNPKTKVILLKLIEKI